MKEALKGLDSEKYLSRRSRSGNVKEVTVYSVLMAVNGLGLYTTNFSAVTNLNLFLDGKVWAGAALAGAMSALAAKGVVKGELFKRDKTKD